MLPNSLKSKPFSLREALACGVSRPTLERLLKHEFIERVSRGVYRISKISPLPEDDYRAATHVVGKPSAICLFSALVEYGLSDQILKNVWIMVGAEKRTKAKNVRTVRVRQPRWNVGIVKKNGYWITSIERTIVDSICSRSVGLDVSINALKTALKKKITTGGRISDVAKKLGVLKRITPYLIGAM